MKIPTKLNIAVAAALAALGAGAAGSADPEKINWPAISKSEVTLLVRVLAWFILIVNVEELITI